MSNHGYGFGVQMPASGGGGGGMPVVADHIIGIDASSYVDPGGGSDRRVVNGVITNIAPGAPIALTPHFDPNNLPILHTGDWVRDASTMTGPGAGDWFSNNRSGRDSSFLSVTEIEMDFASVPSSTGHVVVIGIYITSLDGAVWTSPYFSNVSNSRVAMQSTDGRIDVVTPDGGVDSNAVAGGDSTGWARDAWKLWAFGITDDTFWSSIDGVESTYTNSMLGAGGTFPLIVGPWSTLADCGFTCIHYWNSFHTLATMRPVISYLATKHGHSYTAP